MMGYREGVSRDDGNIWLARGRNDGRQTHGIFGANSSDEGLQLSNNFPTLGDQKSGRNR